MTEAKNILICIDLAKVDESLTAYADFIVNRLGKVKKVVYFHNLRTDFLEGEIGLDSDVVSQLKDKIEKKLLKEYESGEDIETKIVVGDYSNTVKGVLQTIKDEHIELLMLGKKDASNGSGIVPQKLLASEELDVQTLLVPRNAKRLLDKIICPVELNKTTLRTMEAAHNWSEASKAQVDFYHIFKVPTLYFPYIDLEDDEVLSELKLKAEAKFKKLSQQTSLLNDNNYTVTIDKGINVTTTILKLVNEKKSDLIIIGRRHKPGFLKSMLGGVATGLLAEPIDRPLLIV